MKNVVFRNCSFNDNYGDGIEIFLANLRTHPQPVSILFERLAMSPAGADQAFA